MKIKRIIASVILSAAMMLPFCGCGKNKLDIDYYPDPVSVNRLSVKQDVVSMKDIDPSEIKKGVLSIKEATLSSSDSLTVTFEFTNSEPFSQSFNDVLQLGSMTAYQEGVEISSSPVGDITRDTTVMSGASVKMTREYDLRNNKEPVTILAKSTFMLFLPGETFLHKEISFGPVLNENMMDQPPYNCTFKGAGTTNDGSIVIDYSMTNTKQGEDIIPARETAVQAFQGNTELTLMTESMTDETHYLKYYLVRPGQTVDFSTSFKLSNNTEDVTVYIIDPRNAMIYAKTTCHIK